MAIPTVAFISPEAPVSAPNPPAVQSITGQHNPYLIVSPSGSGVVYEVVFVTPEIAREWLEANTDNRRLRRESVGKLSRDLEAKRFEENGDAIRFADNGDLADGQHRLHAIDESGIGAWVLVVSGLSAAARRTVDDAIRRTLSDWFTFEGEPVPATLSTVVRRVQLWMLKQKSHHSKMQLSTAEYFEILAERPELREAAQATDYYRKEKVKLPPSTIGLSWWLFSAIDPVQCKEFYDRLADGAMLQTGHPILLLRDRLKELAAERSRPSELYILALVIKSWNEFRAGKNMKLLKFAKNETFPTPK